MGERLRRAGEYLGLVRPAEKPTPVFRPNEQRRILTALLLGYALLISGLVLGRTSHGAAGATLTSIGLVVAIASYVFVARLRSRIQKRR